ncbi:hypothetical protein [Streptomyces sp. NRRL B-24085]|uniref:hypothetical protein n=1 Tax=Streptomyces sp. NRRL B-24085 TaxID=1709476 RepID=UPI0006B320F0|nr:hypothetical protein [Streptomyces sp. NRRL B-24085]
MTLLAERDTDGRQDGRRRWWVAVADGVKRLDVLRAETATDDEPTRRALRDLASMVATPPASLA